LLGGHNLLAAVEGQAYTVMPEDVEVRTEAKAGYVVASEGAYLAALKTELTPELEQEGLAREFVRHVQELRKQAGLDIADRIHLSAQATPRLAQAIAAHRSYILGEVLARTFGDLPLQAAPDVANAALEFDGERAQVSLYKAT
jgi:isoleucyl-tRNA synthetase